MKDDLFQPMESRELGGLRVIGFALVVGAVLFAAVATALPFLGSGPSTEGAEPDASLVRTLSLVHGFLLVSCLTMASFVPYQLVRNAPDGNRAGVFLIRWSMIEGAALLGIVVVLLAGLEGVVPDQPVFYGNLLSTFALLAFVLMDTGRLGDAAREG